MTRRRAPRIAPPAAVVWTNRALADLQAIGDYIALDSPVAARRWVDGLMALAERAAAAPLAGRRVPEIGNDSIREVFKRTCRLVYRLTDHRIEVLTVFEGHRILPDDFSEGE
ncbi:MAG: type II toxin-antitoxin system RelE/ParE family toxin [Deltaproteobacteria bacterium]|nr:type II toxin-antitoxin system RelE/ParE family toxin [Deltaproteobacteria bacterium]